MPSLWDILFNKNQPGIGAINPPQLSEADQAAMQPETFVPPPLKAWTEQAAPKDYNAIADTGVSLLSLPQRAFGAAQLFNDTGQYNPGPIFEAATLPMGTGAVAGVSAHGGEQVLGTGLLRKSPPPLVGTYHATGAPTEFSQFKLPPPSHDLGIHTTIDPNVADAYAYPKSNKGVDFMSGTQFGAPDAAGVRIKPVLTDVRNAMKYPIDAGKWNYAENVITGLEDAMYRGFKAPKGILEDMYNISGTSKTWQEQFAPMLQDRGIDSLFYPHSSPYSNKKFNTFMVLDPKQVIPRFSEEGQALIADRGVKEPMIADRDKWRVPQGVLYNPNAMDTLKGALDEGASPFIQDKYTKHQEFMDSIGTKTALEVQFQKQLDAAPDWTTKLAAYKQAYDNNLFSKESFEMIQNNILKKIADKEPIMWFKK